MATKPVELTQEELKTIVALIARAIPAGGLSIGDMILLLPLFQKFDALIEKVEEEKVELSEPKN